MNLLSEITKQIAFWAATPTSVEESRLIEWVPKENFYKLRICSYFSQNTIQFVQQRPDDLRVSYINAPLVLKRKIKHHLLKNLMPVVNELTKITMYYIPTSNRDYVQSVFRLLLYRLYLEQPVTLTVSDIIGLTIDIKPHAPLVIN